MKLSEIRSKLRTGDVKRIARTTGYTENYVSLVLNGKRNPNARIIRASEIIIRGQEDLDNKIKNSLKK